MSRTVSTRTPVNAAAYAEARAIISEAVKSGVIALRYFNTYGTSRTIKVFYGWNTSSREVARVHVALMRLADSFGTGEGRGSIYRFTIA